MQNCIFFVILISGLKNICNIKLDNLKIILVLQLALWNQDCSSGLAGGAHGKCSSVTPVVMGVTGLQPGLLVVYTHCSQRLKVHVHGCYKDRGFLT